MARDPADVELRWKVQGALVTALEAAMRLLHPFMPFLTEEIWQQLPKASGRPQSIMITLYPVRDVRFYDDASEASMALVQKVIVALRTIRAEKNIAPSARLGVILTVADDYKKTILEGYKPIIAEQGRCAAIRVGRSGSTTLAPHLMGPVATGLAGDVEVMVPLEGLVDPAAERAKLVKEREKVAAERDRLANKLANPKYVANAKAEAVEKDRASLLEMESRSGSPGRGHPAPGRALDHRRSGEGARVDPRLDGAQVVHGKIVLRGAGVADHGGAPSNLRKR